MARRLAWLLGPSWVTLWITLTQINGPNCSNSHRKHYKLSNITMKSFSTSKPKRRRAKQRLTTTETLTPLTVDDIKALAGAGVKPGVITARN